jgi:subfamily B ATP-binding cassette protein MsbA
VLHKGQIVESGRHEELLARGGRYRHLYHLQYGGQQSQAALG